MALLWLAGSLSIASMCEAADPDREAPLNSFGHSADLLGESQDLCACRGDACSPYAAEADCDANASGWFDNLSIFLGIDGSKQPQDFGVNAHLGGRFVVNWGLPLVKDWGLGAQIGTSLNDTDNAIQVLERVEGTTGRLQSFTTVGLFQRTDAGLSWAVVYDILAQEYYDNFDLGQWRGYVGFAVTPQDELGLRAAISHRGDSGRLTTIPLSLDPITQGSVYWRRTWESCTSTGLWVGVAEGHSEANFALGDLAPVDERLVFGVDLHAPLNDRLAVFGEANFITPADTGTVDAYLGIVYYLDGGAYRAQRRRYAPVLPVAGNPTFSVDLAR